MPSRGQKGDLPSLMVFLGSARRGGNTELLCKEAIAGAREVGAFAKLVRLSSLSIRPCRGCLRCRGDGKCRSHSDRMAGLLKEVIEAQAYLFATPVYFWNVSGLMKMFFDRLLPLLVMSREGSRLRIRSLVSGRKAGIIVVQEEEEGSHQSIPMMFFMRNFSDFGLEFAGSLFAFGALRPGDIKKFPFYLEQARKLGRLLAS